ncbi:hypothetical protein AA12717_0288 [Gluconacetobacter sacchari DSM 12717]|uniref:Uncharacterized protein n=2 Tax=Gluconacetobacter sacchari TaxID=92759 RepID=A0A7W4NPU3_9PROT|nr:hypothetical protein [Gluconacetobacter sacchari]MBB2159373.1 hypothetical protein [Gluconacetobacter sacchari]GBQ19547.1 hypothetical protein AA12717_0288 [Gluconacetobacter sacchari DSM 12717]
MTLTHDERTLMLHMIESSTFPGTMIDAVSAARSNLREGRFLPSEDRKLLAGFIASAQVPGRIIRSVATILDKLEVPIVSAPSAGSTAEEVMCGLDGQVSG